MAAGCRCSSGSAHATATLLSTTTSVTGHLLQGSIGGIPAFESPRVVAIGADVVGGCQAIRIGCRQRRQSLDLLDSRATTGQPGAAVALDDRLRVWERADLPVLTGLPVAAGVVGRSRIGGAAPLARVGPSLPPAIGRSSGSWSAASTTLRLRDNSASAVRPWPGCFRTPCSSLAPRRGPRPSRPRPAPGARGAG